MSTPDRVSRMLARIPEPLVALAAHAAVPVALDPAFVHLVRTNFFLDPPGLILPYSAESRLLLSPLCREIGDGLYEIPPDVRTALLRHLHQHFGPQRIREVATLLWQYCERAPWSGRPELERAQQLAALSCIDPYRAQAWLNEKDPGGETLERKWFVAMQEEIEGLQKDTTESARPEVDVAAFAEDLLRLDFVVQVETAVSAMRERPLAAFLLHGPQGHAQWWVLQRILKSIPPERSTGGQLRVITIDIAGDVKRSEPEGFVFELGKALGVEMIPSTQAWEDYLHNVVKALVARARNECTVVVLMGVDRADVEELSRLVGDFWGRLVAGEIGSNWSPATGLYLMLVDHHGTVGGRYGESAPPFELLFRDLVVLPELWRFTADDLLHWLAESAEHFPAEFVASPPAAANEILENSDRGIPERALQYIAWRAGVPWARVQESVDSSSGTSVPDPTLTSSAALMNLAREYDQLELRSRGGDERNDAMRSVVARMRSVSLIDPAAIERLTGSINAGDRLAAIVALTARPDAKWLTWLAGRLLLEELLPSDVTAGESAFIGLQAALALDQAARSLGDLEAVRAAVALARERLGPKFERSDRREVVDWAQMTIEVRSGQWGDAYSALAQEYDQIRRFDPSGDQRTEKLDRLAVKMTKLPAPSAELMAQLVRSPSPGMRLQAIAALFQTPDAARLEWLGNRPSQEKAFLGYWATVALARAAEELDLAHGDAIRDALLRARAGQRISGDPDQAEKIARGEQALETRIRRPAGPSAPNVDSPPAANAPAPESAATSPDAPPAAAQTSTKSQVQRTGRGLGSKLWQPGQRIRIKFLDGTPELRRHVEQVATEWMSYANLRFEFMGSRSPKTTPAQIRITFKEDAPWSYLGTDALQIPENQPTMSFGGISGGSIGDWDDAILSQFGHALGLVNEHQNPNAQIPWNREVVLREMSGPPNNWSRETVEHNIFDVYDASDSGWYRDFDPKSVMMRRFSPTWVTAPLEYSDSPGLSKSDREFVERLYPWGATPEAPPAPEKAPPSAKAARRRDNLPQ